MIHGLLGQEPKVSTDQKTITPNTEESITAKGEEAHATDRGDQRGDSDEHPDQDDEVEPEIQNHQIIELGTEESYEPSLLENHTCAFDIIIHIH